MIKRVKRCSALALCLAFLLSLPAPAMAASRFARTTCTSSGAPVAPEMMFESVAVVMAPVGMSTYAALTCTGIDADADRVSTRSSSESGQSLVASNVTSHAPESDSGRGHPCSATAGQGPMDPLAYVAWIATTASGRSSATIFLAPLAASSPNTPEHGCDTTTERRNTGSFASTMSILTTSPSIIYGCRRRQAFLNAGPENSDRQSGTSSGTNIPASGWRSLAVALDSPGTR